MLMEILGFQDCAGVTEKALQSGSWEGLDGCGDPMSGPSEGLCMHLSLAFLSGSLPPPQICMSETSKQTQLPGDPGQWQKGVFPASHS